MLYHLFNFLEHQFDIPGAGLFQFLTFRAGAAAITSLLIGLIFGKKIINFLRKKQMGEIVRDLGLQGQIQKQGTPTMGGIIIISATLIPVLLFAKLDNIYVILLTVSMLWMGFIGFLDDYLKKFRKNKDGLKGIFKIMGQVFLGLIIGITFYFHPDITIRQEIPETQTHYNTGASEKFGEEQKAMITSVPFYKDNVLSYSEFLFFLDKEDAKKYAWLIFIPIVIFIITAVSNGANLTDGIDGLAGGTSVIAVATLALIAWLSGNIIFADYLNIMFIPNSGEVTVFCAALIGGLIGFLWYNTYPAQVFMGDTGSLMLGGVIAVLAIIIRKEMLIPILCGIFLIENLSVILQVSYFKYTKKKFGEGRRIFLMSPLHHHYQKKGYHESKIVNRFLIIGILLAIVCFMTLKLQ
ncbi:MAG: phospho-N-acetylmuramoyl-pentapeptide-transferase [Flavobacteriales bacterium]|nr:phospho-N-acetylmuramoyl-pentapeptide-transferase [Flavobacteriales bacterium]